jgi:succinate-semialdehyde dehydrogenase/glutarate-semialdehyde dehydrogenase
MNIKRFASINPVKNELMRAYDFLSNVDLQKRIEYANEGYQINSKRTFQERAKLLMNVGHLFERDADSIARTMALEMGKPLAQGKAEVMKTANHCKYYAVHAEELLKPKPIQCAAKHAQVVFQPVGPLLSNILLK